MIDNVNGVIHALLVRARAGGGVNDDAADDDDSLAFAENKIAVFLDQLDGIDLLRGQTQIGPLHERLLRYVFEFEKRDAIDRIQAAFEQSHAHDILTELARFSNEANVVERGIAALLKLLDEDHLYPANHTTNTTTDTTTRAAGLTVRNQILHFRQQHKSGSTSSPTAHSGGSGGGGIETIISCMKHNREHDDILRNACSILLRLPWQRKMNAVEFVFALALLHQVTATTSIAAAAADGEGGGAAAPGAGRGHEHTAGGADLVGPDTFVETLFDTATAALIFNNRGLDVVADAVKRRGSLTSRGAHDGQAGGDDDDATENDIYYNEDEEELLEQTTSRLHAELRQIRNPKPSQASLMLGIIMLSFLSLRLPGQREE